MNFSSYKNYKDIGLPGDFKGDFKGHPFDYQMASALIPGHPSNYGQSNSYEPLALSLSSSSSSSTSSRPSSSQQGHDGSGGRGRHDRGDEDDSGRSSIRGSPKKRGRSAGPMPKSMSMPQREKTFGCSSCSKAFYTRQHLQQHERIHTGECPYRCSKCDRKFIQLTHLNQHIRSDHADEAFPCLWCHRLFLHQSLLDQHNCKQRQRDDESYRCSICQAEFDRLPLLSKHMAKSHPPPIS